MTSTRHLEPVPEPEHPDAVHTPPHDRTAEQIVLGAMMLSPNAVADIADIVTADDFYEPRHGELYTTIVTAFGKGEPTDTAAIANRILNAGNGGRYANGAYLHDLIAAVPTVANAGWYARIIAAKAARRRLLDAATQITQIARRHPDDDPTALADAASAALYAQTDQHITTDVVQVGDLIKSALDTIDHAAEHNGRPGLPTGIRDLDDITGGPQPGQFWVIAGRPGMGKSVHATDIARAAAIGAGQPVLYFSLEMDREVLMQRLISAQAGVRYDRMRSGYLDDGEWTRIGRASGDISDAPLYVDDTSELGLAAIRAKTRRIAQRGGLGLVIVDYLQLMQTTSRRQDNREREVAELSRGLKVLSGELHAPIIGVAQLNRGPEQRHDKTPGLADLRESGALENDADVVILVHRDEYYTKAKSERPGEVDLIVAKNRHGRLGTAVAASQLHMQRFADMAAN